MQIGLFDHLERTGDRSLATQFDERLEFAVAADEAGFYALHVAEHHCSPLNMIPVPGLWLAAIARATKRLRFGPLVYLLPLYSPLRLAEEICMLDHLSKGRFEPGVGRGVSPYELAYHKIRHEESRDIFKDAYECLKAALGSDVFSYESGRYQYKDVPMPLRPLQQPWPAFWYASSNEEGSTWAGEHGLHFTTNGAPERAKANIDSYLKALAQRGGPAQPKAEFSGGAAIGMMRHIVVADTDAEAERIAKPALEHHAGSLNWIRKRHGVSEFANRANVHRGESFEEWRDMGMVIAGAPDTVVREIERQVGVTGINYLITYLFFGSMSAADAHRSLNLFRGEVMPRIKGL
jgi:alkanesulfonate monooxygenase SsuD/methylene tetrahydromethanopterin reductase-like flavin-dependent oxidoreductase (luciferase family)